MEVPRFDAIIQEVRDVFGYSPQDDNVSQDEYLTTSEYASMFGIGEDAARRVLHYFRDKGRLDVKRKQITTLSGGTMKVAAYKILPEGNDG